VFSTPSLTNVFSIEKCVAFDEHTGGEGDEHTGGEGDEGTRVL
jgi:hypothetical protein